ncbi:MAG TPA: CTP synthase, partial [Candidatus Cloacimonadota bacterium]|nr:CTP synthase [Candidatus Cloacimonadota bacterium]
MAKHIFVIGGVLSSLGKGIASASIGFLLQKMGYKVAMQKLDPYLNVDPGTMSPFQHGEVFVTDDGSETDLDLGHYERFTGLSTNRNSNTTSGVIYENVIKNERKGEYLGKTVQVIPHVTNEIKHFISKLAEDNDIVITEIGGTVGDIESLPFLEAVRQFRLDVGYENSMFIFLSYVPYIHTAGEVKTKPTQHSAYKLREIGIQPDLILCRCEQELDEEIKQKIALFTNVNEHDVFSAIDVSCVYEIPKIYYRHGV